MPADSPDPPPTNRPADDPPDPALAGRGSGGLPDVEPAGRASGGSPGPVPVGRVSRGFLDAVAARRGWRLAKPVPVLAALVAVLLVVVGGLVVVNVATLDERDRARVERDQALSRQLSAQSQAMAVESPQLARLLAVAAARIVPASVKARAAVRAATATPQLAVLGGFPGEMHAVAFGPDGATLAAAGRGTPLRVWQTDGLTPVPWPQGESGEAETEQGEPRQGEPGQAETGNGQPDGGTADGGMANRGMEDGMAVAYSRDGRHLAVASATGQVRVWDTRTRESWSGGESAPWSRRWTAFSPDGKLLATTSGSTGASRLWDVGSGRPVAALHSLDGAPGPVAFSPDGSLLAAAYPGGLIRTFDVTSGRLTGDPLRPARGSVVPEPREEAGALAFGPGGRILAGTTGSEHIQLWNVATRRAMGRPLTGHTGLITSAAFNPDGSVLATAGQNATIRLWDVRARRPLGEPLTGHTHAVNAVAFSPGGDLLASAGADATVRLWRVPRGVRHRLTLPGTSGAGGEVPADRPMPDRWYERQDTTQAVLSADAARLVVQPYDGTTPGYGAVWSWDVKSARRLGERLRIRPDDLVDGMALSPDGRVLAASGADDAARGLNTTILDGPASIRGRPLAYSPDGRLLATEVPSEDPGAGGQVPSGGASGQGSDGGAPEQGAVGETAGREAGGAVWIWAMPGGQARVGPAGYAGRVTAAAFDPRGALLAVGTSDGSVLLWDVAAARSRGTLRAHALPVTSLAFAPDGRLLLSGGEDQRARLWDVATARPQGAPLTAQPQSSPPTAHPQGAPPAARPHGAPLIGHTGSVRAVAFAPDGTFLATGGQDRTIRLWDTATGRPLGPPLAGHGGEVRALAFTGDGKELVAAVADLVQVTGDAYTVWKWDTTALTGDVTATACAQAARSLTREEWAAYVPGLPYRDVCP
ncbi:WD40 repeat domain-containing protein [Nonomuraea sp. NPDC048882]|uniref:WD40 repeat domain-containing protein n=1 Tax=Nonomuraea sp. NPDC048882 TaxID=3154347 RepID=UPI0033D456CC